MFVLVDMYMTPQQVIRITALRPAQPGKTFRRIGVCPTCGLGKDMFEEE